MPDWNAVGAEPIATPLFAVMPGEPVSPPSPPATPPGTVPSPGHDVPVPDIHDPVPPELPGPTETPPVMPTPMG